VRRRGTLLSFVDHIAAPNLTCSTGRGVVGQMVKGMGHGAARSGHADHPARLNHRSGTLWEMPAVAATG
jgi:hypothetical protein